MKKEVSDHIALLKDIKTGQEVDPKNAVFVNLKKIAEQQVIEANQTEINNEIKKLAGDELKAIKESVKDE